MAVSLRYSTEFGSLGGKLRQNGLDPYCLRQKCSSKNLVLALSYMTYGDIRRGYLKTSALTGQT